MFSSGQSQATEFDFLWEKDNKDKNKIIFQRLNASRLKKNIENALKIAFSFGGYNNNK